MEELAQADGRARARSPSSPATRTRRTCASASTGVKQEAAKYPGIKIVDTFYHIETPQDAAAEVIRVQNAYPADPGLGDDRRLAALHADAADGPRSEEGEDRRGRRAAGGARLRREGARAGAARAADLPVGLRLGADASSTRCSSSRTCRRSCRWSSCASRRTTSGTWARQLKDVGLHRRAGAQYLQSCSDRMSSRLALPSAFEHVTKRFPGVVALDDVSFDVAAGSCHALCGENGAGKSTLGKILAGIHPMDGGRVVVFGEPVSFVEPRAGARRRRRRSSTRSSRSARTCRSPRTSASGRFPARGPFVSRAAMRRRASAMLAADRRRDRRATVSSAS